MSNREGKEMKNKEIYENEIAPLLDRIFEICDKNNFDYLTSFDLGPLEEENGESLMCSSTQVTRQPLYLSMHKALTAVKVPGLPPLRRPVATA